MIENRKCLWTRFAWKFRSVSTPSWPGFVQEGQKCVVLDKITVPWEESIAEAHEWKLLRYEGMKTEIQKKGVHLGNGCRRVGPKGFSKISSHKISEEWMGCFRWGRSQGNEDRKQLIVVPGSLECLWKRIRSQNRPMSGCKAICLTVAGPPCWEIVKLMDQNLVERFGWWLSQKQVVHFCYLLL